MAPLLKFVLSTGNTNAPSPASASASPSSSSSCGSSPAVRRSTFNMHEPTDSGQRTGTVTARPVSSVLHKTQTKPSPEPRPLSTYPTVTCMSQLTSVPPSGIRNADCGIRSTEYGIQNPESRIRQSWSLLLLLLWLPPAVNATFKLKVYPNFGAQISALCECKWNVSFPLWPPPCPSHHPWASHLRATPEPPPQGPATRFSLCCVQTTTAINIGGKIREEMRKTHSLHDFQIPGTWLLQGFFFCIS